MLIIGFVVGAIFVLAFVAATFVWCERQRHKEAVVEEFERGRLQGREEIMKIVDASDFLRDAIVRAAAERPPTITTSQGATPGVGPAPWEQPEPAGEVRESHILMGIQVTAINRARSRNQTVGEKNDYYITLEQLEAILLDQKGKPTP